MHIRILLSFLMLAVLGCAPQPAPDADGHGHDHGPGNDHQHGEAEPGIQSTLFNDHVEVFMEHAPLVKGRSIKFAIHITLLDGWRPVTKGELSILLARDGMMPLMSYVPQPTRDGLYTHNLEFPEAGAWNMELEIPTPAGTSVLKIPDLMVYATAEEAPAAEEGSDDEIQFLKEQQWKIPFEVHEVAGRTFRNSFPANGSVIPRASGEAHVHAPAAGKFLAPDMGVPHIGRKVSKGQLLGKLLPRIDDASDPAALEAEAEQAGLEHDFAAREVTRLEGLLAEKAIPANRLREARLAKDSAAARVRAAREKLARYHALQTNSANPAHAIEITAPIDGVLVAASAIPGAIIGEGASLFHIVDLEEVWLRFEAPESEMGKAMEARGAWFQTTGNPRIFEVGAQAQGALVAFGGNVDPETRTAPLIFSFPNPEGRLINGMFLQGHIITGNTQFGPSVPVDAVIDEGGQDVVYVQTGGESFERRVVRLGVRDGSRFRVLEGVKTGERVVAQGAWQVRLAGSAGDAPDHGHAH